MTFDGHETVSLIGGCQIYQDRADAARVGGDITVKILSGRVEDLTGGSKGRDGNVGNTPVLAPVDGDVIVTVGQKDAPAKTAVVGDLRGGGIGTNSSLTVGDGQMTEYTLTVNKVWDTEKQPDVQLPESVDISLVIGDRVLDSITLTPDNGWSGTFTRLPDPDTLGGEKITVREDAVPQGFEVSYSEMDVDKEAHTMSVTVTNHAAAAGDGPQTDVGETGPGQPGGGDALQTQDQIARTGVDEAAGAAAAVLAVALTGITAVAVLRQRRSKTDR